MPWISITSSDIAAAKMAPLVSALRTAALADGQSDPVVEITANVVSRIRRKIAACAGNRVDADAATVPASLKSLACRLILIEAKNRLEIALTDDERKAWDVDERELNDIAACRLPIEEATAPVAPPVQAAQPPPTISGRRPQFTRRDQDGA